MLLENENYGYTHAIRSGREEGTVAVVLCKSMHTNTSDSLSGDEQAPRLVAISVHGAD